MTVLTLHPYSYTTRSWAEYKALTPDSLDVIFVGNSHQFTSTAPMQLWRDYGIASWDVGASAINTPTKLAYVEEALKTQHPQALVLEVHSVDQLSVVGRQENDWAYDNLPYTAVKARSILRTVEPRQWEQYLVPLTRYHANYTDIKPGVVADMIGALDYPSTGGAKPLTDPPAAEGDVAATGVVQGADDDGAGGEQEKFEPTTATHASERAIESLTYIEQIAEMCARYDIQLVCYLAPQQEGYEGNLSPLPWLESELGATYPSIRYLNLNDVRAEIGLTDDDFRDGGHVYAWGMTKVTRYLYENLLVDLVEPSGASNPDAVWWDSQAALWKPPASLAEVEE